MTRIIVITPARAGFAAYVENALLHAAQFQPDGGDISIVEYQLQVK